MDVTSLILIIVIASIFIRGFYVEGGRIYKEHGKQFKRKIAIMLYKILLGFVYYFKKLCILLLILAPAITTFIWRQDHLYEDDTFIILVVISIASLGLGILILYCFYKIRKEK